MKPDRPGIWEWTNSDGIKRLVEVVNPYEDIGEVQLEVYWWGGYYLIEDSIEKVYDMDGNIVDDKYKRDAEWVNGTWGNRIGDNHSLPEDQLYLGPTQEEFEKYYTKALKN